MFNKAPKTKKGIVRVWTVFSICLMSSGLLAQNNVGIGTTMPTGKLHIAGTADISQLIIKANSTQTNTNPLIRLQKSDNTDLMWIHSDSPTNSFIGYNSGKVNTGLYNSFFGSYSGGNNISGAENTALGYSALDQNTFGNYNTAVGAYALHESMTGVYNCAIGEKSLYSNNSGSYNAALGIFSLYSNTIGTHNIAIGPGALSSNEAGSKSVAIGYDAMSNANNADNATFDTDNVAVGYLALRGSFTPANNTGKHNTAIGSTSMTDNTSGEWNTAVGANSLNDNTTGLNNTAIGVNSLEVNTNGNGNTATGLQALKANTTGDGNTAVGIFSIFSNTTGDYNTAIGQAAYFTSNNLTNTTAIGYLSGGLSNVSNRIEIGNTSVSWIGGQMTWGTYSDGRIKDNVREDVPGLDFVNRLRPVTYNLNIHRQNEMAGKGEDEEWEGKYDIEQMRMTGFIAQEVEQAAHAINYDFSGVQKPPKESELYSLRYAEFVMPLVKSVQELSQENEAFKSTISNQKEIIEALTAKMDILEKLCQENQQLIREMIEKK